MSRAFIGAMLRDPVAVGAIWPSGPALARAMVRASDPDPAHVVVELGAGTGPITQAILARHAGPFLALEPDAKLAARCRRRCPQAEVVEAFAADLPALLAERGHLVAHRILSGLPFAIWPADRQDEALDAVCAALDPHGSFVTFTYAHSPWLPAGRRLRATLERRFQAVHVAPIVWANLPPATFYCAERPR